MKEAGKSGKRPLDRLDMSLALDRKSYEKKLRRLQERLRLIQQSYLFSGNSAAIVFEGWDAAGKGGTIRRISEALDPRSFKVWTIGAPRRYYLERHFLARFMERLPPNGAISAFDRSWYGRVLVERVENLTPKSRWQAAYREINDFERMLGDDGTRVVKLFFHITPEEQLKRFERRLTDPLKRWKLTYEDFRNRGRWPDYEDAINEMIERTSTRHAPWTLVAANDKKHARIAALGEIVRCLGRGVDLAPPTLDERTLAAARDEFDLPDSLLDSLAGRTE
ncbi:Polyphosphate kinase 2, PPK2 family [Tistlia consotensis]|uniref:Polyphosphate kinase 2, PPK2 family n=1 Tax=Tistlia consotensis USBA 355 TaxID=560819 RepID=A0A1Y6BH89_9PROT|nr:polyphosphate kinase [Tistlia consotensis]SMF11399.1 Polyphosphate kinase 2, PPK2 family [Tistlia consotensis USBA 355]SNR52002.1 Polyphosphate kinase 2, PPK2 family [Tistlia consotensis]